MTAAATAKSRGDAAEPFVPDQPHVVLVGGQRLLGQVDAASLAVLTGAKVIDVPPQSIRSLRNVREEIEGAETEANRRRFKSNSGAAARSSASSRSRWFRVARSRHGLARPAR